MTARLDIVIVQAKLDVGQGKDILDRGEHSFRRAP
jgi:hypothetical protein